MTIPTLALGISAAGAAEVIALANAVQSLKTNLKELGQASSGQTIGNLESLAKEFREMRQELNTTLQGLRTDLAGGFKQAFEAAGRQVKSGGDEVAQAVEKAKVKIKTAASVPLADGIKSSMSISGFDPASVLKVKQEIENSVEAQIAARNKAALELQEVDSKNTLRLIAHDIGENSKLVRAKEKAAAELQAAEARITLDMIARDMGNTDKLLRAKEKAAAQLQAAEAEITLRTIAGEIGEMEKLRIARERAAAQLQAADAKITLRMIANQIGEADELVRAKEKAAAQLQAAEAEITLRMIAGDIGQSAKLHAAREKAAQDLMAAEGDITLRMISNEIGEREKLRIAKDREAAADIAQNAALTQRIIASEIGEAAKRQAEEKALYTRQIAAEASYSAMSPVGQMSRVVRARSMLDMGAAPENVAASVGGSALNKASKAEYTVLRAELDALRASAPSAAGAMNNFSKELRDAQGAARGAAQGFGVTGVALTALLPMMAGFGISAVFTESVKMGSQVQQEMTTIKVLSEESAGSVADLTSQMLSLGRNGPFGPLEVAKAMKTLSLAGLDAKEVGAAINEVLHFAIAGDTSIEKSADLMTTIGTAFKISANDYNYIGDVVAKTAAVSKASVETIAGAFKSASVINSQYGVSLKDVGVGVAILNNVGVAGTSAGTALRNFYVDILGRTPKVGKALQAIGLDANFAFDKATGKARDFVSIVTQLNKALDLKDPIGRTKALQDIFSERGGKAALEAVALSESKLKSAKTGLANDLLYIQAQIEASAGFMSISYAQMALTAQNQMKTTASALQTSLVQSFEKLQPYILDISTKLRAAFNSEEFQTTIEKLVTLVGNLTLLFVEHAKGILEVATAWLGLKVVGGVFALIEAGTGKVIAMTAALGGNAFAAEVAAKANNDLADVYRKRALAEETAAMAATGAATATRTATSVLGTLLTWGGRFLGWGALAVGAWQLYSFWTDKATDSSKMHVDNSGALLTSLRAEADRLHDINQARILNISLEELQARKRMELDKAAGSPNLESTRLQTEAEKMRNLANSGPANLRDRRLQSANSLSEQAATARSAEATDAHFMQMAIGKAKASVADEAAIQAKAVEDAMRARQVRPAGANGQPLGDPYSLGNGKGKGGSAHNLRDNEASTLDAEMRKRQASIRDAFNTETALLDSKHRNELVSEGAFQAAMLQATEGYEKKSQDNILTQMDELETARAEREKDIRANLAKSKNPKELSQALSNLENDYSRLRQNAQTELDKVTDGALLRQVKAVDDLEGGTNKLMKTNDAYWAKADAASAKETAMVDARRKGLGLSEEERAEMEARTKVAESHTVQLNLLSDEYTKAQNAIQEFKSQMGENYWSQEAYATYDAMKDRVDRVGEALKRARGEVSALADQAGKGAVIDVQTKKVDDMAKAWSAGITDAILDGGKDGTKKLKDWIKNYFIREPIRVLIQGVMQPLAQSLGSSVFAGSGSGGGFLGMMGGLLGGGRNTPAAPFATGGAFDGTGSSGVLSGLSGAGSISSLLGAGGMFGAGGLGGSLAAGAGWLTGATTLGGSLTAATSLMGTAGGLGAGLGMAAGALGPIAIGAALAFSLLNKKKGGPKQDGVYGAIDSGIGLGNRSAANDAVAKSGAQGLQQQYDDIIKNYSGLGGVQFGLGYSKDPQGTSPTFLDITAKKGGATVNQQFSRDIGRDDSDLEAAIKTMGGKAVLDALQKSNIQGELGKYLKKLGDVASMAADDVTAAIAKITKASTEKSDIESRAYDLLLDDVGKLAYSRQKELDALDETNRAMARRLYSLQDEKKAQQDTVALIEKVKQSAADAVSFMAGVRTNIKGYLDQLDSTDAGQGSPESQLAAAKAQFTEQLALAKGGDRDALSNITEYADRYKQAQIGYTASGGDTQSVIAQIKAQLAALPNQVDATALIVKAISDGSQMVKLSIEQMQGVLESSFTTLDTNLDGIVDFSELKSYFGPLATDQSVHDMIASLDANGDGVVTKLESITGAIDVLSANVLQNFSNVDVNVNGLVDFSELKSYLGPLASDATVNRLIASVDQNGDGVLSKLEFMNNTSWASNQALMEHIAVNFRQIDYDFSNSLNAGELARYMHTSVERADTIIALADTNGDGTISWLEAINGSLWQTSAELVQAQNQTAQAVAAADESWVVMVGTATGHKYRYGESLLGADAAAAQISYATADGGAFTNNIFSSPTMYGTGNGKLGIMGEGGKAEAVMPLVNVGGKLGVHAVGGGADSAETIAALQEMTARLEQALDRVANITAAGFNASLDVQADTRDSTRSLAVNKTLEDSKV